MTTTTIKIAGIDLELFEAGQGAPLLWLHGAPGFNPKHEFVELVAARRRLIAPSHPGFGKSSLPDWLDSVDDIAHVYLELLDRLGLEPGRHGRLLDRRLDRGRDGDQGAGAHHARSCWSARSA